MDKLVLVVCHLFNLNSLSLSESVSLICLSFFRWVHAFSWLVSFVGQWVLLHSLFVGLSLPSSPFVFSYVCLTPLLLTCCVCDQRVYWRNFGWWRKGKENSKKGKRRWTYRERRTFSSPVTEVLSFFFFFFFFLCSSSFFVLVSLSHRSHRPFSLPSPLSVSAFSFLFLPFRHRCSFPLSHETQSLMFFLLLILAPFFSLSLDLLTCFTCFPIWCVYGHTSSLFRGRGASSPRSLSWLQQTDPAGRRYESNCRSWIWTRLCSAH